MCLETAYYDTCVFLESLNEEHGECNACRDLLDVPKISWDVNFCGELSSAESSAGELIDNFEVECASHGVSVNRIPVSEAKALAKEYRGLKKLLTQRSFGNRDWTHLMAAVASGSKVLCTTDPDFWDPRNKVNRKAKVRQVQVQNAIEEALPIEIRLPSEALGECCN